VGPPSTGLTSRVTNIEPRLEDAHALPDDEAAFDAICLVTVLGEVLQKAPIPSRRTGAAPT
jgi:hypothetical protein